MQNSRDRPVIDLRSDTVTKPTPEMYEAMCRAPLGDDTLGDDPTVRRLQDLAAERVGKEAALFVPSGMMANHFGVRVFTNVGDRVICEHRCHLYGASVLAVAGVQSVDLHGNRRGEMDLEELRIALRPRPQDAPAALLCLENSFNGAGGTALAPGYIASAAAVAHDLGVPVYLDGARIFNAAIALGVDATEFTQHVDVMMFCLSKGLGSPAGSLLCGPRALIDKARGLRYLYGGSMRQAGILAACGLISLEKMVTRLVEDHRNARLIAEGLATVPGIELDLDLVQTNLVWFDLAGTGISARAFVDQLGDKGVLAVQISPSVVRIATHKDISTESAIAALEAMRQTVDELA
jgi:threonine aldolase